jgi:hypothetical protein
VVVGGVPDVLPVVQGLDVFLVVLVVGLADGAVLVLAAGLRVELGRAGVTISVISSWASAMRAWW